MGNCALHYSSVTTTGPDGTIHLDLLLDFVSCEPGPGSGPPSPLDGGGGSEATGTSNPVCSLLPEGRVSGISGAFGLVGGLSGSVETVVNYNTGEVSGFLSGGLHAGYVGGLSGSGFLGAVRNLGNSNNNYAGPFTNASVGAGPFALTASASSGGLTNPGTLSKNGVQVVSGSVGASFLPTPVSLNASVTYFTNPIPMGNIANNTSAFPSDLPGFGLSLFDRIMFFARQVCK